MADETYNTDAPECPYCGHKQQHDGGYLYDEDLTEIECDGCQRTYDVEVFHRTSWTCRPQGDA